MQSWTNVFKTSWHKKGNLCFLLLHWTCILIWLLKNFKMELVIVYWSKNIQWLIPVPSKWKTSKIIFLIFVYYSHVWKHMFCEQFFATKSINKSVLYSRLTDEHLHFLLRLTNLQDLEPNIESLLTTKCCQKSSSPWTVWGQIYLPQTVKHQGCCGLTALYHLVTGWMSVLRVTLLMIIYYSNSQYTHSSNE